MAYHFEIAGLYPIPNVDAICEYAMHLLSYTQPTSSTSSSPCVRMRTMLKTSIRGSSLV